MDFQTKLQPQPVCYCHAPHYTTQPPKYIYPCLTCIFIILILALVVLLIGPSILISIYHPSTPIFNLASIDVSGFNISPLNSKITTDVTIKFSIENPNNKTSISYENVQVCIYYERYPLKCTFIQSFSQGARTQMGMVARIYVEDKLTDRHMMLKLGKELMSKEGLVGFAVQVSIRAWFDPGSSGILGWGWQNMRALCKNVTIWFSANRSDGILSSGLHPHACMLCAASFLENKNLFR